MKEPEYIQKIRSREESGMEEFLRHYTPLMRYIIAPVLPDARDQEECISEVAMRVWEKIDQYDPSRGSWNAWLTALTRNVALNRSRKKIISSEPEEEIAQYASLSPTPEQEMLRKERQQMLQNALQRLASRDRMLFYRKYYYQQSTAQIASELGLTERAVEGRLYRIRKRLQEWLGGEWHES